MFPFTTIFKSITLYFGPFLLLVVSIVNCQSKKKSGPSPPKRASLPGPYKGKIRADLSDGTVSYSIMRFTRKWIFRTPPAKTPMERSGNVAEDTLANVKSLPPEKSDDADKPKKKKKK